MIGAEPNTDWLRGCLDLDEKGFVHTGRDREGLPLASPYATTRPGVFAVGDVRAGSVKRVASGSAKVRWSWLHPPVPEPGSGLTRRRDEKGGPEAAPLASITCGSRIQRHP